jgi:hypothetical protein
MRNKLAVYPMVFSLCAMLAVAVGCSKAPTDAQVTSDIQAKLSADSGLQGKQVGVQANKGTVTLSGVVDNEAQRGAAAKYSASVAGVKQVVNNIQIDGHPATSQSMQAQTSEPPAPRAEPTKSKPSPSVRHRQQENDDSADNSDSAADTQQSASAPPDYGDSSTPLSTAQSGNNSNPLPALAQANQPSAPAPAPPQTATIPSGTNLKVRLVDEINTKTAQQGDSFRATLDAPISVNGQVVVHAGYDVDGHIVAVQSAGQYSGQSTLTLQLDRITVGDKHYFLQSDQFHKEAASRSKNTAEKVGGGAVVGAIIGGIFGGGKGAAIGAGAGGAAGGGVQAASKSGQIDLPSETVLNFALQSPVTVTVADQGPNSNRQPLGTSNNQ